MTEQDTYGNIYQLKDKDITDKVEFEIISCNEYEHTVALDSLIDDRHGS